MEMGWGIGFTILNHCIPPSDDCNVHSEVKKKITAILSHFLYFTNEAPKSQEVQPRSQVQVQAWNFCTKPLAPQWWLRFFLTLQSINDWASHLVLSSHFSLFNEILQLQTCVAVAYKKFGKNKCFLKRIQFCCFK